MIPETSEWTFDLIERCDREIARVAGDFGLKTYPNQIEVISSEQMMDAYTSVGMPVSYNHWSFGKHFAQNEILYRKGLRGLAYEMVEGARSAGMSNDRARFFETSEQAADAFGDQDLRASAERITALEYE